MVEIEVGIRLHIEYLYICKLLLHLRDSRSNTENKETKSLSTHGAAKNSWNFIFNSNFLSSFTQSTFVCEADSISTFNCRASKFTHKISRHFHSFSFNFLLCFSILSSIRSFEKSRKNSVAQPPNILRSRWSHEWNWKGDEREKKFIIPTMPSGGRSRARAHSNVCEEMFRSAARIFITSKSEEQQTTTE